MRRSAIDGFIRTKWLRPPGVDITFALCPCRGELIQAKLGDNRALISLGRFNGSGIPLLVEETLSRISHQKEMLQPRLQGEFNQLKRDRRKELGLVNQNHIILGKLHLPSLQGAQALEDNVVIRQSLENLLQTYQIRGVPGKGVVGITLFCAK